MSPLSVPFFLTAMLTDISSVFDPVWKGTMHPLFSSGSHFLSLPGSPTGRMIYAFCVPTAQKFPALSLKVPLRSGSPSLRTGASIPSQPRSIAFW